MSSHQEDDRAARLERAIRLKLAASRGRGSALPARPADQTPLLSEMQRSLWLTHQMDPGSAAYNLVSVFRLSGPLDLAALEHSFNEVVSRHRILRSTFRAGREGVVQIVNPHAQLEMEKLVVENGAGLHVARREAGKPFDLAEGPLIRMVLIEEQSGGEARLLLALHHIIADERSLDLLWEQLAVAYAGQGAGAASAIQFDDYVYWSAKQTRTDRGEELEYWRQQLDPLPDELNLPFETLQPDPSGPRGRLLERPLASDLLSGLRRLAAATGSTPFTVFAFTFRLLLERYVPGRRIAFATPATTRSHPAAVDMIGYFLNPVVLCTSIDEGLSVEEAVGAFAREMRDRLSHASVPFDVLAEELSPTRRPDRHPIYQVMFVHRQPSVSRALGDVALDPVELDLGESKFDLTLFVSEGPSSLDIAVEYRADRFDEVWMQNLLGHYETLLSGLVGEPGRTTSEVPILTSGERATLGEWQGAISTPDDGDLLPQQILARTRQCPEATSVICGGTRWSYDELGTRAAGIASALVARSVGQGDRVGLFLDRSPLMIAGLLASHWAGAAYVPLDPGYPAERNREVLDDADAAAVLTTSGLCERLPGGNWPTICVDEIEGRTLGTTEIAGPDPEAVAYILYTSGSTGRPKGVVVTHDSLRASTEARRQIYDFAPERFLLLPSVAFDSSVAGIFWTLSVGGTLVIPTDEEIQDPRRLAQIVAAEGVDSVLCVPSLYAAMLKANGDQLHALREVIVAGESCSSQLVRDHLRNLPDARLFNEYGPTEATVWATVHEVGPRDAEQPVAVGRPIPGVQVRVLDRLSRTLPAGIPGEAWIGGRTVAQGYWRREDLSQERFVPDPGEPAAGTRWYRTGDLMSWTAEGTLVLRGRQDDQIKLRGFRIEPGEIEAALLDRSEIEEAAVVARSLSSGAQGPKHLVAFLRTAQSADSRQLRLDLEKRLPDFMMPQRFVELAELPRLPNGKIDRDRLRDMSLGPEAAVETESLPTDEREHALVALWEGLLGRSGIGVQENFFELGGHSLLVVEMTLAIERDHGARLAAAEVFQNPTVRQLAQCIEHRREPDSTPYAHLFPVQPGGQKTPFIVAIPHVFTEMLATRFRGERPVYGLRGVGLRPEGNRGRWPTMRHLAEDLVEEIERRFPEDRYIMAGYSFGATMAFEAVRLMEEREIPVQRLYLISPMPLNLFALGPLRLQIDGLRKPLAELTTAQAWDLLARENNPLTRRPYGRAWRSLVQKPWRHYLCLVGRLRRLFGLPLTPRILHADVRLERFRLHRGYQPGIIRTPTVIFNPKEAEADIAATWRPYFEGPLTVVETLDPHLGDVDIERSKEVILRQLDDLGEA